jgi:putative ABC transport system permease protein
MDRFLKDLGFAVRAVRSHPGFAATAIITLALGIGVSTAIFSVVNAVLLRPLPYKDADRLVFVWGDMRNRKVFDFPMPPGDYRDLQTTGTLFEEFGAVSPGRAPLTGDGGQPEQVKVSGVTPNLLSMLGVRVLHGRPFVPEDALPQPQPPQVAGAAPGAQPAPPAQRLPGIAVLNYGFWQRRYGGDTSIIGKTIDLGGGATQVVGVLAPGFELLFPPSTGIDPSPDVLVAMRINFEDNSIASRVNVFLRVFGKIKRDVPFSRAQEQVERLASDLRERFPIKKTAGLHFRLERVADDVVADVRPAILALMGAVVFVLLIACANVANLLLVRASARERELAVRAALGSSPWRLVRQMLAESLVLAGAGAALGVALAWVGIKLLVRLAPASLPRLDAVAIDPLVLGFAVAAALVSVALFGVLPAVRASRPDVADVLRAGRTPSLAGGRMLRNVVVAVEVALSFVLLIGSGLMVRSFAALSRVDPGYDARSVLTFTVDDPRGNSPDERAAFSRQLAERLRALPGVRAVTAAAPFPLDGGIANARWGTEEAAADNSKFQQANVHIVLPGYFDAMHTKLYAGRAFTEDDNKPTTTGIIIDNLLAAKAFPNTAPQDMIGKRLLVRVRSPEPEWLTVQGIVQHERHEGLATDGREAMFVTDGFVGHGAANTWAIRVSCRNDASCDPTSIAPSARATISQFAPLAAVAHVQPMTALVDQAMASTRFALVLIGIFAVIAAVLAAVGLYGVLSTVVRQRTAEIGVRMAFGAENSTIFQMMIGQGLRLSAIGIACGLVAALLLTRVMSTMLVGVTPTDPLTFVAIAALFVVIAALASWLPARRAASLDPTVALREE